MFPALLLGLLLAAAVWHDVRDRRIPNALVLPGALAALLLQALLPPGSGFFTAPLGALGLLPALGGLALGLLFLLPMYALRAMGAGDVKLMAMIGAFVGMHDILGVVVATLLAGGALAILVSLWQGTLVKILSNTYHMILHSVISTALRQDNTIQAPAAPSGKLPYAIAIATGTVAYLLYAHLTGGTPF